MVARLRCRVRWWMVSGITWEIEVRIAGNNNNFGANRGVWSSRSLPLSPSKLRTQGDRKKILASYQNVGQ